MNISKSLAALLGCTALTAILADPASAQSVPAGTPATETAEGVPDIVVTAQKRAENINDVPLSITTASGQELLARGVVDPTQLETLAPGFSYQKSSYGVPVYSIRGVGFYDTTQGVTPAVAVYVDQIPLPYSAMTRGAGLDVERVEILKGPQGTLFGQNSTGGAINYIAAKPTSSPHYGFNLEYGRFDALAAEGYASGPITSTLRARIALRTEQQGDWQYSYTRDATLGAKHYIAGRVLLDWDATAALRFELGVTGWKDTSDTQAPQLRQLAFQSIDPAASNPVAIAALTGYPLAPANARAADWDIGRDFSQDNRFWQVSLRSDLDISSTVALTSLTAYAHYRTHSLTDGDATNYTSLTIRPDALLTSFSQELRLAGSIGGSAFKWMLGGNYANSIANEDQFTFTGGTSHILLGNPFLSTIIRNHQKIDTKAVFGSVDVALASGLKFQGSIRYTDEKRDFVGCIADSGDGTLATAFGLLATILSGSPKTIAPGACVTVDASYQSVLVKKTLHEDNLSWRGSLNWEPVRNLLLYVSLAKGYKAGNFATIPGLTPEQFNPLRQESVLTYEAGFKATLFHRTLQLNGAGFYYDYKNKQLLGSIQNPIFGTLPASVAIPKSRISGFEFDLTWRPVEGLRVTSGLSYVVSRITSNPPLPIDPYGKVTSFVGEAFPYTPKWQGSTDIEYGIPVGAVRAFVGGTATYRSSTYSNFGENPLFLLDGRTLLDLRAGVERPDGRWRFQIWGRNVTNKYYFTQTSRLTDTVLSYAGMPVTYGATFSFRY